MLYAYCLLDRVNLLKLDLLHFPASIFSMVCTQLFITLYVSSLIKKLAKYANSLSSENVERKKGYNVHAYV